jgi:quinol monooxygenase YgiN
MIIFHAFIKIKPEHRETFLEQVKEVIAGSQSEEGNISYHLYEDFEQKNTFVMIEEWKDQEATESHRETVHYKHFMQNVESILSAPVSVKRYVVTDKK